LPLDLSTIYWHLQFPTGEGKAGCLLVETEINKLFVVSVESTTPQTFLYKISNEDGTVEAARKITVK